jgi:hypothetical protein
VSAISLCILLVHVCYHTLPSHGCFRNLSLHSHNLDASSSLKQGKRKIMVERVQGFYVIGLLRHWAFTSYLLHRAFTLFLLHSCCRVPKTFSYPVGTFLLHGFVSDSLSYCFHKLFLPTCLFQLSCALTYIHTPTHHTLIGLACLVLLSSTVTRPRRIGSLPSAISSLGSAPSWYKSCLVSTLLCYENPPSRNPPAVYDISWYLAAARVASAIRTLR